MVLPRRATGAGRRRRGWAGAAHLGRRRRAEAGRGRRRGAGPRWAPGAAAGALRFKPRPRPRGGPGSAAAGDPAAAAGRSAGRGRGGGGGTRKRPVLPRTVSELLALGLLRPADQLLSFLKLPTSLCRPLKKCSTHIICSSLNRERCVGTKHQRVQGREEGYPGIS